MLYLLMKAIKARKASKMPGTQDQPVRKRRRRQRACVGCNERKVKCDLLQPCGECQKKSLKCVYLVQPISTLTKSALRQVADRMTIEMDIYKKLEVYWRNLAQSAWAGNWTGERGKGEGGVAFSSEMDLDDRSSVLTLASLLMFTRATEIILPQYTTNFEGKAAKNYWALLTQPIHFDLNGDFEDASYRLEKRSLGILIPSLRTKVPSHVTEDALRSNVLISSESRVQQSASPSSSHNSLESQDLPSSPTSSGSTLSSSDSNGSTGPHSPNEQQHNGNDSKTRTRGDSPSPISPSNSPSFIFPSYHRQTPSYARKVDNALVTANGRLFDPLDDFMRVKFTSAADLVNLLEYGAAFLIGLLVMERAEITNHFALNCRRILNDLIWLRKDQMTTELATRLVNCATIMSFYYATTSEWGIQTSVLLFAHMIATEHRLDQHDPIIAARVHLTLLWFARTQGEREYYMRLCSLTFPSERGIDFRCKFSYISSSIRSQRINEPSIETEESAEAFWERVTQYMDDCDRTFDLLDKFGLAPHSLLYFKALACVMRAELGPRVKHSEWTIEQGMLLQKQLGGLSDIHTLAALSQLKSFCSALSSTSAPFEYHTNSTTVSKYLLSVLDQISVAPPLSAPEAAILSVGAATKPTFPTPNRHSDPGERFAASQQSSSSPSSNSTSMDISTDPHPPN